MALSVATARLELAPLTAEALDALIAGDGPRLTALTGARVAEPVMAPPLMEDVLPFFRDRLRAHPGELGWWPWLSLLRASGEAVGALGFAGPPGEDGTVTLGYATYPAHEGHGYAGEAASALTDWALARPGVARVRATVPVGHEASLRVARRAGLAPVGRGHDDEAGEVVVLERAR